jgi:hypothetical protein
VGLHEPKKLPYNKRNDHQIEEAAHKMGEKSLPAIHLTQDYEPEYTGSSKK